MAINLSDIHDGLLDYFSSVVVPSIKVTPIPVAATSEINPGEKFSITLTAKNSAGNSAKGIQIINVCYHVSVDDPTKATLIAPESSVAVTRENFSSSSALVKPGDERQELFLFHDVTLQAGDTDTLDFQGHALTGGTPKLTFHVHGEVDLAYLLTGNQKSANTSQSVSIRT
jgi:hypothetical protein